MEEENGSHFDPADITKTFFAAKDNILEIMEQYKDPKAPISASFT